MDIKKVTNSKGWIMRFILLVLMLTASTQSAWAQLTNIYASELKSQNTKNLKLTNTTVLYVDADLTLTKITGNWDLNVLPQGDHTLTVYNPDGTAIDVKTFACSANLTVRSLNAEKGIEADYILLSGGIANLTGDKNVVYAYKNFSATDHCESLTVKNYKNDYSAVYSEGTVSIECPKVMVTGKKDAVRAYDDLSMGGGEMTFISASTDGVALHSYNGNVRADSCDLTATGGMAIRAEKNIYVKGTLKATSINIDNCAILSDKGSVTLEGTSIVNGGKRAIECNNGDYTNTKGNLSVKGDLTASNKKADCYCIAARYVELRNGTVTINSTSDAIHIEGTDSHQALILSRVNLTATSSEPGSTALNIGNSIGFNYSVVKATGGTAIRSLYELTVYQSSVYAKALQPGGFAIKSPTPQYASRGKLYLDGSRVFSPENFILDPKNITIYNADNTPAQNVVIVPQVFEGTVKLNTHNPHPGDTLRYELSDNLKDLKENGIDISPTWNLSLNGGTWTTVSEEDTYVVHSSDIGRQLFVHVTSDSPGYNYAYCRINSDTVTVTKRSCTAAVVAPELSILDGKIRVNNAQSNQEYIIFNTKKEVSSLTDNDWSRAVYYDGLNPLYLNGTPDMVNYVYTRVKETPTTKAGTDIATSEIYYGEITYVRGIKVRCKQVKIKVVNERPTITNAALEEENGHYYCKVGDVIRVDVSPIPEDATNFDGISASRWYNNTNSGTFYSNPAGTIALEEGKQYKTVYFVPTEVRNNVDVHAEHTLGYNWMAIDWIYLNVGDENGRCQVDHLSDIHVNIAQGATKNGIELEPIPSKAWIGFLTVNLVSGEGTPPDIRFYGKSGWMTVDASDATAGTYQFEVIENGKVVGHMTVTVTAPVLTGIELAPADITADPGSSHELLVQTIPSEVETTVTWTSSDESIATVTADGVVTIAEDAPIGAKATITASSGDISGICVITVSGETYELWVADTQVTSRNQDDVLGDGTVSFDGLTLTLNNADIQANEDYPNGIEHYLDYLIINLEGDSKVESKEQNGLLLGGNTQISGAGTLNVKGASHGIQVGGDELTDPISLSIDNTTMNVEGFYSGFCGTEEVCANSLDINNSAVTAKAQHHSGIWKFSGGITLTDCQITEPAGATYDSGTVMNGEAEALTVVISPAATHLKGDVNLDGKVDISDVVAVINTMAGDTTYKDTSDVNEDEKTDISDVVSIINIMAGQ